MSHSIIVVRDTFLNVYNVGTLFKRQPRTYLLGDVSKMHIWRLRGCTDIHLQSQDGTETTISTQFLRGDIRTLEQFMAEQGIEVLYPEK
ncbi:MAG: hypothetical protein JNL72_15370 [Flavipsychrobacter sp.]|nr:hypothetical protein [Flavipsychrobacter sp.]